MATRIAADKVTRTTGPVRVFRWGRRRCWNGARGLLHGGPSQSCLPMPALQLAGALRLRCRVWAGPNASGSMTVQSCGNTVSGTPYVAVRTCGSPPVELVCCSLRQSLRHPAEPPPPPCHCRSARPPTRGRERPGVSCPVPGSAGGASLLPGSSGSCCCPRGREGGREVLMWRALVSWLSAHPQAPKACVRVPSTLPPGPAGRPATAAPPSRRAS